MRASKEMVLGKKDRELEYGEVLTLERAIHRIIGAMLDICRHVASAYSLGLVENYASTPVSLPKRT